ncbi:hypothetical protein K7X08_028929 [Anisodus acutangulus]|uniref:Uncharacterized protein n=1 Tax=Anisodus acutangulus TaxID=402998 RepID=A0A9Q1L1E1_9SOLA|nr:hypothetical protein K7X08_028929 [Anisodus acutangulus]
MKLKEGISEVTHGVFALGASPGALTDPSAEFPLGRTPADLAFANGHKGISGFLTESSLTTHLSTLTVADVNEHNASEVLRAKVIETTSKRVAVPTTGHDVPDVLSLKDSLADTECYSSSCSSLDGSIGDDRSCKLS